MSEDESIGKSFRELLTYISSLGEHINQIYERIERIETSLKEAKNELDASITNNEQELERVREIMITKTVFNNLLKKLNEPFKEFSPPPTPEHSPK